MLNQKKPIEPHEEVDVDGPYGRLCTLSWCAMPRKEGRLLQEGKDRMLQERQEGLQEKQEGLQEKEKSLQKGLQAAKRSSKELLQRQITTLT